MATLSPDQIAAYVDRFLCYRKTTPAPDSSGQIGDDTYSQVGGVLLGAMIPTPNNTSPAGAAGLLQEETLLTEDRAEFPYDADIRSEDVLRCITTGTKRFGKLWTLMGDPQELDDLANCQEARLRQTEHLNALMPDAGSYPGS